LHKKLLADNIFTLLSAKIHGRLIGEGSFNMPGSMLSFPT